jgi:hypothetical protein
MGGSCFYFSRPCVFWEGITRVDSLSAKLDWITLLYLIYCHSLKKWSKTEYLWSKFLYGSYTLFIYNKHSLILISAFFPLNIIFHKDIMLTCFWRPSKMGDAKSTGKLAKPTRSRNVLIGVLGSNFDLYQDRAPELFSRARAKLLLDARRTPGYWNRLDRLEKLPTAIYV